jgi:hypothetical protein
VFYWSFRVSVRIYSSCVYLIKIAALSSRRGQLKDLKHLCNKESTELMLHGFLNLVRQSFDLSVWAACPPRHFIIAAYRI